MDTNIGDIRGDIIAIILVAIMAIFKKLPWLAIFGSTNMAIFMSNIDILSKSCQNTDQQWNFF